MDLGLNLDEVDLDFQSDNSNYEKQLFRAHLKQEKWDFFDMWPTILVDQNVPCVHWDSMIYAERDNEFRLFLMDETMYPPKIPSLYERGLKTIAYITSLREKNIKD